MDYIALYVDDHWSHKPSYFNPNLELPVLLGLFYLLYGDVIRIFHANLFKIHVHIHRDQEPSNFVLTLHMSFDSLIIVQKQKTPSQSHVPFQLRNQVSVCPEMGSVANPVLPELRRKK